MHLSPRKQLFVDTASNMFGAGSVITKSQLKEAAFSVDIPEPYWFQKTCKIGYNQFKLPSEEPIAATTVVEETVNTTMNLVATNMEKQNLIPSKFVGFVPWGHHSTINQIVQSV